MTPTEHAEGGMRAIVDRETRACYTWPHNGKIWKVFAHGGLLDSPPGGRSR